MRLPGSIPEPGPGAAGLHQIQEGPAQGQEAGFPQVKKRGRCKDSFRFSTGAISCAGTTVTLPRLGVIRTHESTRKLARRLQAGTARIVSATVSRTAGRWFVSFTVKVDRAIPERHARPGSAIGVDRVLPALGPCAASTSSLAPPGSGAHRPVSRICPGAGLTSALAGRLSRSTDRLTMVLSFARSGTSAGVAGCWQTRLEVFSDQALPSWVWRGDCDRWDGASSAGWAGRAQYDGSDVPR